MGNMHCVASSAAMVEADRLARLEDREARVERIKTRNVAELRVALADGSAWAPVGYETAEHVVRGAMADSEPVAEAILALIASSAGEGVRELIAAQFERIDAESMALKQVEADEKEAAEDFALARAGL